MLGHVQKRHRHNVKAIGKFSTEFSHRMNEIVEAKNELEQLVSFTQVENS